MQLNADNLRADLAQLDTQKAALTAVLEPLAAERDTLIAEYQPQLDSLTEQVKAAREGIYEIDQERSQIVKVLAILSPTGVAVVNVVEPTNEPAE